MLCTPSEPGEHFVIPRPILNSAAIVMLLERLILKSNLATWHPPWFISRNYAPNFNHNCIPNFLKKTIKMLLLFPSSTHYAQNHSLNL